MNNFLYRGATLIFLILLALPPAFLSATAPDDGFLISGTVVDEVTGAPLANARIEMALTDSDGSSREMVTTADGRFTFENVTAGKYRLTAERQGYLTRSLHEHDQFTTLVVVGSEAPSPDLTFPLPPESSIAGSVTDDRGEALRSATVMLFSKSTAEGMISIRLRKKAETDDRGFYTFNALPQGKYYVAVASQPWYARYPGFSSATNPTSTGVHPLEENIDPGLDVAYPVTFYSGVTDPEAATAIPLASGDNEKANIVLHAVPSLHLRAHLGNPEQSHGNDVTVEQSIFGDHVPIPVATRQTGPGVIELAGIPPGHYSMRTDSMEQQHVVTETKELDASRSGDLNAMPTRTSATLTVSFPDGVPLPKGAIRLWNRSNGTFIEEQILGRHKFHFEQRLAPGAYEVLLPGAPEVFIRRLSVDGIRVAGRIITLKGADPATLTITTERGTAHIEGIAVRANNPASGVMVVLVPDEPENDPGPLRRQETNTDGSFAFSTLAPGTYRLLAIENGWDMDWANAKVLKRYLEKGESAQAAPSGTRSKPVRVNVQ
jgi:hypothetical protein